MRLFRRATNDNERVRRSLEGSRKGEVLTAGMDRDERRRVRELVRVDLEELVDAIFGLAGRVPVGLLSKVVLVVLRGSVVHWSQRERALWHA